MAERSLKERILSCLTIAGKDNKRFFKVASFLKIDGLFFDYVNGNQKKYT